MTRLASPATTGSRFSSSRRYQERERERAKQRRWRSVRSVKYFLGWLSILVVIFLELQVLHVRHRVTDLGNLMEQYMDHPPDVAFLKSMNLPSFLHSGAESTTSIGGSSRTRRSVPMNAHYHSNSTGPSFVEDGLCGACRSTKVGYAVCRTIIARQAENSRAKSLQAVAQAMASQAAPPCKACVECPPKDKQYWRYDHAAPRIWNAVTHYLPSVPAERRIPPMLLLQAAKTKNPDGLKEFFKTQPQLKQGTWLTEKPYLFEYNPSIVVVPSQIKENVQVNGETPTYIASFRISTQQSCFPTQTSEQLVGGDWSKRPQRRDFLALALLREDLSLLQDVILNLPKSMGYREDFRLFVLHGQLYLSSYCLLVPLWIKNDGQPVDPLWYQRHWQAPLEQVEHAFPKRDLLDPYKILPSLQVYLPRNQYTKCTADDEIDQFKSKNLNYFINAANQTMVELQPLGTLQSSPQPHVVIQVDPTGATPSLGRTRHAVVDDNMPFPSFYTQEDVALTRANPNFMYSIVTADRGGACCIPFTDPRSSSTKPDDVNAKYLLLGVSHVKTPYNKADMLKPLGILTGQYLSRFYAFEPFPPYRVMHVSGFFCLTKFHSSQTGVNNPLGDIPLWNKMQMGDVFDMDCPKIHFISGMIEKANNPSTLIVSYGVADCTSWFIEVDKQDVVDMLFEPPKELRQHQQQQQTTASLEPSL